MIWLANFSYFGKLVAEERWSLTRGGRNRRFDCYWQGRSQGRVPGVLEPPFWAMKMDIISRGEKYRNPPFEIPRDDIFVFEEEQKKSNLKRHHMLSHLARKHPRSFLSDILAEWMVNHKSTAFDEACNMLNNYYIIQFLIYSGPSLQEARFTILS